MKSYWQPENAQWLLKTKHERAHNVQFFLCLWKFLPENLLRGKESVFTTLVSLLPTSRHELKIKQLDDYLKILKLERFRKEDV